ncbi:MAG TPA: GTPase [Candidatus Dormibacteraeota bacterium]|nr:GTPase [Candidatus Dormibacteraeota bacterium]
MPHRTQMRLIKRRLVGKEGSQRIRELRAILDDLPDYRNGPFADIRKWVMAEIDETRSRSRVIQRDHLSVRREGAAQVALVGAPNGGKSSLLHALSDVRIRIGDYAFTTLRPVPALIRIGGVLVQLVEIPGLIAGAHEDRGGGRALLGVLREADAVVYCQDVNAAPSLLAEVLGEVAAAGIERPCLLCATKMDEAGPGAENRLAEAFPDLRLVGVSILDGASLDSLREAIWSLTGLVRVCLRHLGETDAEPIALPAGATVREVAASIHRDLAEGLAGARIWGPSARFEGQRVGPDHVVEEGDAVEVLS